MYYVLFIIYVLFSYYDLFLLLRALPAHRLKAAGRGAGRAGAGRAGAGRAGGWRLVYYHIY